MTVSTEKIGEGIIAGTTWNLWTRQNTGESLELREEDSQMTKSENAGLFGNVGSVHTGLQRQCLSRKRQFGKWLEG